jgi:hypothetical protein
MQLCTKYTILSIKKKSQPTIKDPEQVKLVEAVERSNIHIEGCT